MLALTDAICVDEESWKNVFVVVLNVLEKVHLNPCMKLYLLRERLQTLYDHTRKRIVINYYLLDAR